MMESCFGKMMSLKDEKCETCTSKEMCAKETIGRLQRSLNPDFQQWVRECRGPADSTASPNQKRRDDLTRIERNYPCPICTPGSGLKPHKVRDPPTSTSEEALLIDAKKMGTLDGERERLGNHARAVDMWLETFAIEERIKNIDPEWRYHCPTDTKDGIEDQVRRGRYLRRKGEGPYIYMGNVKLKKRQ
jgi:hypothetical protein